MDKHDLSSLRVIGSVGEPINDEAWHWYNDHVGNKNVPIVDTWWQTETGGILISLSHLLHLLNLPMQPYLYRGVQPVLMDDKRNEITGNRLPETFVSASLGPESPVRYGETINVIKKLISQLSWQIFHR